MSLISSSEYEGGRWRVLSLSKESVHGIMGDGGVPRLFFERAEGGPIGTSGSRLSEISDVGCEVDFFGNWRDGGYQTEEILAACHHFFILVCLPTA